MRRFYGFSVSLLVIAFAVSCTATKRPTYFQTLSRDTTIQAFMDSSFESKIQKGDLLYINVSSLSAEMDAQFNGASAEVSKSAVNGGTKGFKVDESGKLLLHHIGKIQAEGLTRKELEEQIQSQLLPFMKEPIVVVKNLNRKVTVMGEVQSPQIISLTEDKMTILDAIVSAGDLSENGNRSDIMVIRDSGSQKQVKHINLENHSVFSSPWFYVQPNDIVYVPANKTSVTPDEKRRNIQTAVSLAVSVVSLLVIVLNAFIK